MSSTSFTRRVLTIVRQIPRGRVATYADVAAMAGRPAASRAVGNIMKGCRDPNIPCHRVVRSNGQLGGYSETLVKQGLLKAEGISVICPRLRHFTRLRWQRNW